MAKKASNSRYHVKILRAAERGLQKLPTRKILEKAIGKLGELETDPRPKGSEKLTDRGERYRIRVGNYRIVYLVDDDARTIEVEAIGDRKEVYRD